jgi:hypothetical protein
MWPREFVNLSNWLSTILVFFANPTRQKVAKNKCLLVLD